MRAEPPPSILLFRSFFGATNNREAEGVFAYARRRHWLVRTVECDPAGDGSKHPSAQGPDRLDVQQLVDFWHPAGCIVACGGRPCTVDIKALRSLPCVILDSEAGSVKGKSAVGFVDSAHSKIASAASRILLETGYDSQAFIPWCDERLPWSVGRQDEFCRICRSHGIEPFVFDHPTRTYDRLRIQSDLRDWIRGLPRPCGVFAVNDLLAEAFVSAVYDCGFSIPEDFAVIGVDDDERLCENAQTTITSVRTDNERAGYLAAEMLDAMMASAHETSPRATFGVQYVHQRASSLVLPRQDNRVKKAVEFIRVHATDGIRPIDVVQVMGCSRRLADLRFREGVGSSILDEIHRVRIERVKALLLKSNYPVDSIAEISGYSSVVDLRRVFKKRERMTLSEWRQLALLKR